MALLKTWIVIADQSNARLYEVDNRDFKMNQVAKVINDFDERREGLRGLGSVSKRSRQSNVRALVNENSLNRRMIDHYVIELSDVIEKARKENKFQKLILVAGPEMMGELKNKLSRPTLDRLQRALAKDYARFKEHEVHSALHDDVRESFLSA